jgi:hypothetical protein
MVVTSFCLFLVGGLVSGLAYDSKIPVLVYFKIGSGHCANRAVMLCWFSAKKVKTKAQCQKQGLA